MNLYLFYGDNKTIINDKIKKMIDKYNIEENNVIEYNLENNLETIIE